LPATTLDGGVPDNLIVGVDAADADPGADELVDEVALPPVA
jgi:hypothetical protein